MYLDIFILVNIYISLIYYTPINSFHKSVNIISSSQAVINHKSVFKNVHYQEGNTACWVSDIMLIDPHYKEFFGYWLPIHNHPADTT